MQSVARLRNGLECLLCIIGAQAAKEHVALGVHAEAWCIGLLHESVKIQGPGAAHCDALMGMTVGGCARRELWHRQEARRGAATGSRIRVTVVAHGVQREHEQGSQFRQVQ